MLCVFVVLCLCDTLGSSVGRAEDPSLDSRLSQFRAAREAARGLLPANVSTRQALMEREEQYRTAWRLGEEFLTKAPGDIRRYEVMALLYETSAATLLEIRPTADETNTEAVYTARVYDEKAVAADRMRREELERLLEGAPDVPRDIAIKAAGAIWRWALGQAYLKTLDGKNHEVDLVALRRKALNATAGLTDARAEEAVILRYVLMAEMILGAKAKPQLEEFATYPNPLVRKLVQSKLALLNDRRPFELTVTDIDGQVIDFAQLRGRVVLLEFWATWCGPCLAEVPNIKRVYDQYHAAGFEVVGVSHDYDREHAGKRPLSGAKTKTQVKDFLRERGLRWPQVYEGNGGENAVARRFDVKSIPESILIDQAGLVVATGVRGQMLEHEVRRLLAGSAPATSKSAP